MKHKMLLVLTLLGVFFVAIPSVQAQQSTPQANPSDQGIGMTGRIQQPPPSDAPTISLPADGTVYQENPVTVTGLCTDTLLIRVFKNGVFSGAAICDGGSYEIIIDLFPGLNELSARQYDDLDQASPESNRRSVTLDIPTPLVPGSPDEVAQRVTLTSTFARRGADPGQELQWPITITGGTGPYAISIDWGDGKNDLLTQTSPETFDIKHAYDSPGVYRIIIKATDANGQSAFLQVVGVSNGAISTAAADIGEAPSFVKTRVMWQPALIAFPLILSSFWLGKRYQLQRVRYRMKHRIIPIDK
jgi:hypothetical protein